MVPSIRRRSSLKKTPKLPVAAVMIASLWASYRLTTTSSAFRRCGDCHDPRYFLIILTLGAISYVAIACFIGFFACVYAGAIIAACRSRTLREIVWIPVHLALAVGFCVVTVAFIIEPFAPSVSGYVWDIHL